jgi:hypothetical protein
MMYTLPTGVRVFGCNRQTVQGPRGALFLASEGTA